MHPQMYVYSVVATVLFVSTTLMWWSEKSDGRDESAKGFARVATVAFVWPLAVVALVVFAFVKLFKDAWGKK